MRKVFIRLNKVIAVSEIGGVGSDVNHPDATESRIINDDVVIGVGYAVLGDVYTPPAPSLPSAEETAAKAKIEKNAADEANAKADAKAAALGAMTPAQVRAWVASNVSNLADAKDLIATLAVAVSVLFRKL